VIVIGPIDKDNQTFFEREKITPVTSAFQLH